MGCSHHLVCDCKLERNMWKGFLPQRGEKSIVNGFSTVSGQKLKGVLDRGFQPSVSTSSGSIFETCARGHSQSLLGPCLY